MGAPQVFGVTLPHVFGDHMVLQNGQPVPVWGWAAPGEAITVKFAGQEKQATAGAGDGRWEVRLDPLAISTEPEEMTVSGSDSVTVKYVLVGEVWLCSGQSNMEKPLGAQIGQEPTLNYEYELQHADFPQIRLLKVQRARADTPARDVKAAWTVCSPATLDAIKFSAAGYFFGRKLFQELKIPIGMIDSSFGGSPIEPWITPAGFGSTPLLGGWARAAQTPGAKVAVYLGAKRGSLQPCTMYNAMIAPIVPFPLRGVLWYQGESNVYAGDGTIYADKMKALIKGWRGEWKRELPFYYVQIAPLLYHVTRSAMVASPEAEPRLWEAQTACMEVPKTGMVVISDCVDDLADIHPRDKKDVGERLARWALAKDYGHGGIEVSGPIFRSMEVSDDKAILHFDHVGAGLVSHDGKPLDWFMIGGADGELYPASAEIDGDTVIVSNPRVSAPTVVHFGWDEAARPNFFNKDGLPAVPFRTDNPFTEAKTEANRNGVPKPF